MNILFLTTHSNIGGISSYLFSLGKGLKKRGHRLFLASSGGELVEKFIEAGMEFVSIPIRTKAEVNFPKIFLSFLKLLPLIKEKNINIIHAHTRVTSLLAAWLSKSCRIPYILTCHGFFRPHFWRRRLPFWGVRVIAISESVKEHLISKFRLPQEKISLIYSGIDLERLKISDAKIKQQAKKIFSLDNGPLIGIIARLSDVKGHIYLIKAMPNVIKEIPEAKLLIVGEGREKARLLKETEELNLEEKVFFIDSLTDTSQALLAMDLFVMPSLQEGLGLSLMEAMAQGLPVVASDIGGIRNLIQDGSNGRLLRPKDPLALAEVIVELLKDEARAKIYGMNARKTITEKFSLGKMTEETERVYLECLKAD